MIGLEFSLVLSATRFIFNWHQREYLNNVQRAGYNLLGIINDILDFSKIESGKLLLDMVPFGPGLIVEIDPLLPEQVLGDAVRFRQILTNLLGNAIKFTETCEIVVSIKSDPVSKADDGKKYQAISLCVKDTGIGIPHEKLSHVFDSFTQADSSTTRKYGGTGLGLTIAKHLAEMLGDTLKVASEPA